MEQNFKLIEKEFFETNIIFDTPENQLEKKGFLLRLRKKNGYGILTLKRPKAVGISENRYKIKEEIESRVTDFDSIKTILLALGFEIFFIYEKYREIYKNQNVLITIDRTPIGNFIEIEGNARQIDQISKKLGFSQQDYIVEDYFVLFRKIKKNGFMTFK